MSYALHKYLKFRIWWEEKCTNILQGNREALHSAHQNFKYLLITYSRTILDRPKFDIYLLKYLEKYSVLQNEIKTVNRSLKKLKLKKNLKNKNFRF